MVYELHAVIARQSLLKQSCESFDKTKLILLNQASLALLPITSAVQSELETITGKAGKSTGDTIFERFTPAVEEWTKSLSGNGMVAYVEAEFFGGMGAHCAVVFNNGEIVFAPSLTRWGQAGTPLNVKSSSDMAINKALRLLGVTGSGKSDEFDALGLGQHRRTENW